YNPAPTSVRAEERRGDTDMVTARTTSTTLDCPASTPANSPLSCTVTVADTDSAPKSAPLGMVSFVVSTSPSGSSSAVAPNPCTLTPGTTSSTCLVTFTANTLGSYTITATYNPAPTSVHATSNGSDTVMVTARTRSEERRVGKESTANSPLSCTVTVADTDSAPKSAPLGMVSFVVSTSPSGSSSAVAPNPCTLTPGTTSSTCLVTFTANTLGSYTLNATYNPAPTSVHATSNGSDTVMVTARTTSTTLDCPASTPANSPLSCTVTVADTDSAPKSAPLGMVSFVVSTSPSGSSSAVAPNPCTLTPGTTSSTCLVTFTANTLGSYTITATYNPAPTSVHATSNGSDTVMVTARTTSTTLDCPASTPANSPLSCTVTVADTDSAPKSAPLGMVSFVVSTSPSGSSSAVAPNPCTLTPGTTSSTCLVTFTANTLGSYTITATYNPAPTS